jgi:flagellar motor protein MotB
LAAADRFSDEVPTDPPPANVDLSKRRAAAEVAVLISEYHLTADRLQANGAGPYAPVSANNSEDGRSLNRGVELVAQ